MKSDNRGARNGSDNNNGALRFKITESIANLGIEDIVLDRGILQFILNDQTKCSVFVQSNNSSIQKLCKDIRNKLSKKLRNTIPDSKLIEQGLSDIEDQIISGRDEIFAVSTAFKDNDTDHATTEFNIKFYEEVSRLRNLFNQASEPHKEWQSKVAEKYENLERLFKKHYPEAWIFLEFCLSIKSILNIMDFTLPFMGILVAVPSSLKTMVIQLFRKYPSTFYTDSFTSSSLVSHNAALSEEQLQKIDMLPKMNNKLVLTPELAPLFTGNEDELQKVLGIITRVLDGHGLENDSGAHGHREYHDIMFVWLGAAVEIPFRVWKLLGTLGHKIYFLRPPLSKKTVTDLIKIAKTNNFSAKNREIEEALLDYLKTFDAAPDIEGKIKVDDNIVKVRWNEEIQGEQGKAIGHIAQLSKLLASLRGVVYVSRSKLLNRRVNYSDDTTSSLQEQQSKLQQPHHPEGQDYDTDFPIIEDPSRAVILLRNLAIGHAISQGRDSLTLEDVPMTIKVALSTAQVSRVRILDLLLKSENGVLVTSQIYKELGISQPVVTKTMREFDALGIADISAVGEYNNSELQIKLNQEFSWFRTKEFVDLKWDFVPYEKENNGSENNDFDKQFVNDSSFIGDYNEKHVNKNGNTDNPISLNKDLFSSLESKEQHEFNTDPVETVEPCDNNKVCHTLKHNPPPEAQQKNDLDSVGIKDTQISEPKREDSILQHSIINDDYEKNNSGYHPSLTPSSSSSSDHFDKQNNVSPSLGIKSFERVTLSHATRIQESESSYQISPTIKETDGIKYITLQEILKKVESDQGSTIAINSAILIVCKENEEIRNYLNDKNTSRENRDVRDLVSNIIRHPNIKIIKNKPQLLVSWVENKDDSLTNSQKGETV